MRQTTMTKTEEVSKQWFLVDAKNQPIGRLSTFVASILRGKHKPTFTPHVDMGDNVIVINAQLAVFTANKENDKMYYSHSGYPGGLKTINAKDLRSKKPTALVEKSIKGMLPHTKLGNKQRLNLYVFKDQNHDKAAQKPKLIEITYSGKGQVRK